MTPTPSTRVAASLVEADPMLRVRGLEVGFPTSHGLVRAVDRVDLDIGIGERVGIVGESGSGKSAMALSILGLHTGATVAGEVWFGDQQLVGASERALRRVRGAEIGLVFQDPLSALNPVKTVGQQITEVLRIRGTSRTVARRIAVDLLGRVGVQRAAQRIDDYPHQFSGGMRQRVLIAAAVIAEPKLLIADEPTTALDVRVQAQVLDLIEDLSVERRMSVLFITHDLGVVAGHTDRVYVMYSGQVLEECRTDVLFEGSMHPYTWGLMGSLPRIDEQSGDRLVAIPGQPPSPLDRPPGCSFADRCSFVEPVCAERRPPLGQVGDHEGHAVACVLLGRLTPPPHLGRLHPVETVAPSESVAR